MNQYQRQKWREKVRSRAYEILAVAGNGLGTHELFARLKPEFPELNLNGLSSMLGHSANMAFPPFIKCDGGWRAGGIESQGLAKIVEKIEQDDIALMGEENYKTIKQIQQTGAGMDWILRRMGRLLKPHLKTK